MILIELLKEYLLITWLVIQDLCAPQMPIQVDPTVAGRHLILIQGANERWHFFAAIRKLGIDLGYKVHLLPELDLHHMSSYQATDLLQVYIRRQGIKSAVLITHSRGGVTAALWMRLYGETYPTVSCIALGPPFKGTWLSFIPWWDLGELASDSPLIQSLQHIDHPSHHRITTITPRFDNHIGYTDGSKLPGAHHILLDVIGHTQILYHSSSLKIIRRCLEQHAKKIT